MKFNMTFLKLLLSSSIIYMAIASLINDEESKNEETKIDKKSEMKNVLDESSYVPDPVLPSHYDVKLIFRNSYLTNECLITINITHATQHISFYVPDNSTSMITRLKSDTRIYEIISMHHDKNNIVLDFGSNLERGIYDLYVQFIVPIEIVRESFGIPYVNEYGEKEWLITGMQSKKQQIFPYWDSPELRITLVMSIVHHIKYKALSNMPILGTTTYYDDMMWTYTHFDETPLISTDSIAFLVSDFHQTTIWIDETINQTLISRPQSTPHLNFAKQVILFASKYMNSTWNLRRVLERNFISFENKVDHVAIPSLQEEIKQTLGFTFYREAAISYNIELDPVAYKARIARLIARGIARKYISNVLRTTDKLTWLNEGLALFLQTYIIDKAMPEFQYDVGYASMMDLFVVQVQHELLYLNTYVAIDSAIEYSNSLDNHMYSSLSHNKGSIIWRMLEQTLPSDMFSLGINKYLNNLHEQPKVLSFDHLWNAMSSVLITNKFMSLYEYNIKRTIDSWIMQRCPFVLEVTRNYSSDIVIVSVQFHDKLDERQYYIPITYTTELNPDFNKTWTNIWLTPLQSKIEFSLEKNQWIIFNIRQVGYYRVNYDAANWRRIAQYLNSKDYYKIHVLNRAQIIDDAFHFAIEKKLEMSIFWDLASYLTREKDYIAWYPMFKAIEFLSNIFPFLDFYPELKEAVKLEFMQHFPFTYWHVFDESNIRDHAECLLQEFAKWNCIITDYPCKERSKLHLKSHLENPEKNKFRPGWRRWTYCNGLKTAERDTWDKVFNDYWKYMKGNDVVLGCLAYSKNSEIIIHYLEIKLPQILLKPTYNLSPRPFEPSELAYAFNANIFLSVLERCTKYMLESLLNNYQKIRHRKVNEVVTLIVIINNVYSAELLDRIRQFVRLELRKTSNISITDVEHKLETRWEEIEKHLRHFYFYSN